MLNRIFQLEQHGTTVRREIIGGVTTFAAMAYILAVNPSILVASGMDKGALITATALSAALMTIVMAFMTNYPIALAAGMGVNAYIAFTVCGAMQIPWPAALGLVFYSGFIFLVLSVTGIRRKLIEAIPAELKVAITCGIGLFIAFIGLKGGGVIVANPATFVTLGDFHQPAPLLVLFGLVLTAVLVWRKVPGAIVIGVLALTVIGLFLPNPDGKGTLTTRPDRLVALPPRSRQRFSSSTSATSGRIGRHVSRSCSRCCSSICSTTWARSSPCASAPGCWMRKATSRASAAR